MQPNIHIFSIICNKKRHFVLIFFCDPTKCSSRPDRGGRGIFRRSRVQSDSPRGSHEIGKYSPDCCEDLNILSNRWLSDYTGIYIGGSDTPLLPCESPHSANKGYRQHAPEFPGRRTKIISGSRPKKQEPTDFRQSVGSHPLHFSGK